MIVGHVGLAGALGWVRPGVSLWWLVPAAIAPDLLDVAFALTGVCNPHGLYTHTIPAALLLGAVIAGVATLAGRRGMALVLLAAVMLHLPLDYVTGSKLYWPGGELYGLRLYTMPVADFALETLLLVAGWLLLRRTTPTPRWATDWRLLALLVALQGGVNLMGERLDKPNACPVESAASL